MTVKPSRKRRRHLYSVRQMTEDLRGRRQRGEMTTEWQTSCEGADEIIWCLASDWGLGKRQNTEKWGRNKSETNWEEEEKTIRCLAKDLGLTKKEKTWRNEDKMTAKQTEKGRRRQYGAWQMIEGLKGRTERGEMRTEWQRIVRMVPGNDRRQRREDGGLEKWEREDEGACADKPMKHDGKVSREACTWLRVNRRWRTTGNKGNVLWRTINRWRF